MPVSDLLQNHLVPSLDSLISHDEDSETLLVPQAQNNFNSNHFTSQIMVGFGWTFKNFGGWMKKIRRFPQGGHLSPIDL